MGAAQILLGSLSDLLGSASDPIAFRRIPSDLVRLNLPIEA